MIDDAIAQPNLSDIAQECAKLSDGQIILRSLIQQMKGKLWQK